MKSFDTYLTERDYSEHTVITYVRAKRRFTKWCDLYDYELHSIDYKGCLAYAKYLQQPNKKGKLPSRKTANANIGALKMYFNYLIDEELRGDNPMENMNIRGIKRIINQNLLSYEELEDLYYSFSTRNITFPSCPHVAIRDKVLVGMMVYQGLHATSFRVLKLEHIDLEKGKIYVPSTRTTNSRTLKIESPQILSLAQYLQESRAHLQESIECYSDDFIPLNGERFSKISNWLHQKLKRINHKFKNANQIRASVITHWLKHHNIREVQYMAGHRYISSTERYVQDDLETLQEAIDMLHPIS